MAQHDMNIANQGFPAFRSDLNSALSALVSNSSSATEPTTTFAYQFWADTTNDLLKQRNATNDGWINLLVLSTGEPASADVATVVASQAEMEAGTESALRSMSPLRVAQAIAALSVSKGKNTLINGDMRISQRGNFTSASSVLNSEYWLDRWKTDYTNASSTFQQTTVAVTDSPLSRKAAKMVAGSTASSYMGIRQILEFPETYAGQTVTLSAKIKSNNANARLVGYLSTPAQIIASTTHTGGGGWETISVTATLSTTESAIFYVGAYICSSSVGNVAITAGDYIEVTDIQLEFGDSATDFEVRSYGEELALCQRYYFAKNTTADEEIMGGYNLSSTQYYGTAQIPVPLRVSPTVTISGSNYRFRGAGANISNASVTVGSPTYGSNNNSVRVIVTCSGLSGTIAYSYTMTSTGAVVLAFDAEL